MASLADRHQEILAAGFRTAAIDIDSPSRHAAMVEKLKLPFPMLSDPDRSKAIIPYGLADDRDPRRVALPALVAAAPGGEEVYRFVARDFADRLPEDHVLEVLSARGLASTSQPPPTPGHSEPGPRAMPLRAMVPYFRGAQYASLSLGMRHGHLGDEFRDDAKAFVATMERYVEAVRAIRDR